MFNKILLACNSSAKLVCRYKITVGEYVASTSNTLGGSGTCRGFGYVENVFFGAMDFLEGEIDTVAMVYDDEVVLNLFANAGGASSLKVVNETNGAQRRVTVFLGGDMGFYIGDRGLFDGIEAGQECIIAIYK